MEGYATDARERTNTLTEIALFTLRTLTIINGGAIVALIALIGQGAGSAFVKAIPISYVVGAFCFYALGLASCIGAGVVGYVSQLLVSNFEQDIAQQLYEIETGEPYRRVDETPRDRGNGLLTIGIILAVASLAFFMFGSALALFAATRATI